MAGPPTRRLSRLRQLRPVHTHNPIGLRIHFACHQFQLVAEFTVFSATAEDIDTLQYRFLLDYRRVILNWITLPTLTDASGQHRHNSGTFSLYNHIINIPRIRKYLPTIILKIKPKDFWTKWVILKWTPINNHSLTYKQEKMSINLKNKRYQIININLPTIAAIWSFLGLICKPFVCTIVSLFKTVSYIKT